MNKKLLFSLLLGAAIATASAQTTTLILQPGAEGKDATVAGCVPCGYADENLGNTTEFSANDWTNGGNESITRSLIEFDLASIPMSATVTNAKLSLFYDPTNNNGSHSSSSGPNTCVLERVSAAWSESTVTWNNQPVTSNTNAVIIAQSTTSTQDYPDLDVTAQIQDMVANPAQNFGFMLKLMNESYYRRMMFASSDNINADRHPKLVITYQVADTTATGIVNTYHVAGKTRVYPNPFSDFTTIYFDNAAQLPHRFSLYDLQGKTVRVINNITDNQVKMEKEDLTPGFYLFKLEDSSGVSTQGKLTIN